MLSASSTLGRAWPPARRCTPMWVEPRIELEPARDRCGAVSGLEKSGPFRSPGHPLFVAPGWFKAKRLIELPRDSCRLQRRGPRAMQACIGKHVFHQAPRQTPTPPSRDRADRVDPVVLLVQETPGAGHRQLIVHHHPPRQAWFRVRLPEVGERNRFVAGAARVRDAPTTPSCDRSPGDRLACMTSVVVSRLNPPTFCT